MRLPARVNASGASLTPTAKVAVSTVAREQTTDRQSNDLQRKSAAATAQARAGVLANHNLLQGVSFAANTVTLVTHGLGAPLTGVHVTMVQSGAMSPGFKLGTPPPGIDLKKVAAIICSVTGVYDILVFA